MREYLYNRTTLPTHSQHVSASTGHLSLTNSSVRFFILASVVGCVEYIIENLYAIMSGVRPLFGIPPSNPVCLSRLQHKFASSDTLNLCLEQKALFAFLEF